MNLPELQTCVVKLGIVLSAVDGKLIVNAPAGVITPELRATLLDHKPALLAHLTGLDRRPAPTAGQCWRQYIATWPLEWRQRWADRAEACQANGASWDAAEASAFQETMLEIEAAKARGESIPFARPAEGISDVDAACAIARLVWDGSSFAESIEEARQHNASILQRRPQTRRVKRHA
jgi:hypothetical protein